MLRSFFICLFSAVLLLFAGLLIQGCSSGGDNDVTVLMLDVNDEDVFVPEDVTIRAGKTVTWINRSDENHTVEPDFPTPGMDSDDDFPNGLAEGDRFEFTIPDGTPSGARFF